MKRNYHQILHIAKLNNAFRARWLASLKVISQVLFIVQEHHELASRLITVSWEEIVVCQPVSSLFVPIDFCTRTIRTQIQTIWTIEPS